MNRLRGRPRHKGRALAPRLKAAMEFHRQNRASGFGGTMTSREARERVGEELNLSGKSIEARAKECRRAAVAWLNAQKILDATCICEVFNAFGSEIDEAEAEHIIKAALIIKQEASSHGVQLGTYLQWREPRMRFLELIRTFGE